MTFLGDLERFFAQVIYPIRVPIGIGLALVLVALAFVAWRRRWDRPLRRHPRRSAAVVVPLLAVLLPLGWFLASPLFIRTELVEAGPIQGSADAGASAVVTAVRSGEFQGADEFHFGSGMASIIQTDDGAVLRFEGFSVLNGPDLHVYLSPSPDGYADGAIDLGKLKASGGSFSYEVPDYLDVETIGSVVIWCKPFAVQFAHATLSVPS